MPLDLAANKQTKWPPQISTSFLLTCLEKLLYQTQANSFRPEIDAGSTDLLWRNETVHLIGESRTQGTGRVK